MGMSADAKLGWGIDFGDPKNTSEGYRWDDIDSYDFEHKVMPGLFGFTEEPPGSRQDMGMERGEWWDKVRQPYNQRLDTAIPLTFEHYGYEFGGTALVLKRSFTSVEWGAEAVDPARLAPPTPEEVAAFRVVTDRLRYDGPVTLLLMAFYG